MSSVHWLEEPPLDVLELDPGQLEIKLRVYTEPSGLYTAVPVVMGDRSSRRVQGRLVAWGRRRGEGRWRYLLVVWPDRQSDQLGRLAWRWRSAWCVFDPRRVRPAHRSEVVHGGTTYSEDLSAAIRRVLPPGHELAPQPEPYG
jgi:hypothetical protein